MSGDPDSAARLGRRSVAAVPASVQWVDATGGIAATVLEKIKQGVSASPMAAPEPAPQSAAEFFVSQLAIELRELAHLETEVRHGIVVGSTTTIHDLLGYIGHVRASNGELMQCVDAVTNLQAALPDALRDGGEWDRAQMEWVVRKFIEVYRHLLQWSQAQLLVVPPSGCEKLARLLRNVSVGFAGDMRRFFDEIAQQFELARQRELAGEPRGSVQVTLTLGSHPQGVAEELNRITESLSL
jgi:hypothetical protein